MSPMRVNLIGSNNGVGLSRDLDLLALALRQIGHKVTITGIGRGKLRKWLRPPVLRFLHAGRRAIGFEPKHDVNIMLEHIRPEHLGSARLNVFVPNPEWCFPADLDRLPEVDAVWTKTRHAEALFSGKGTSLAFIGFTSKDRLDAGVTRERRFFHLAGRSSHKGTQALINLWRKHPEWPMLTIVQNPRIAIPIQPPCLNIEHLIDHLDDDTLLQLQNACLFHLCPSETEGFGHYLVESLSAGAVTITTDAPPMNELIGAGRGLCVGVAATSDHGLATTHFIDPDAMAVAVEKALALDDVAVREIGESARAWYLKNHLEFPARLDAAFTRLTDAA